MSRDSLGLLAGIAVLAAGVFTIASLGGATTPVLPEQPAASSPAVVASTEPAVTDEVTVDLLPGVPMAVQRVLFEQGKAIEVAPASLDLPPAVARVLMSYGVPLMVPNETGVRQ
jgi:hypothetical protein